MRTTFFFVFIWLVLSANMYAQCSATPWMTPTILSSDASFGSYAFNIPSNGAASDNMYAEAASTIALFSGNTEYLKATGFDFSIPASATLCGIEVQVERSADNIGLFTSVDDASVRLLKNGAVTGGNRASAVNWTSTDAVAAYGSSSDSWGATLVPNDVNANGFGVAVSARISGLVSLLPVARIDQVRMRVHYLVTLALDETIFSVTEKNNVAVVEVAHAPAGAGETLEIERCTNGKKWESVYKSSGKVNITWRDEHTGHGEYYYRLRSTGVNGEIRYSAIRRITIESVDDIHVTNPITSQIEVSCAAGIHTIELFSPRGEKLMEKQFDTPVQYYVDGASLLPTGIYLLKINGHSRLLIKR